MKRIEKNLKKHLSSLFVGLAMLISFFPTDNIYSQYPTCTSSNPCPTTASKDYEISGDKWNKSNLTYYFANGTDDITGDQEKTAFYTAFATWAAVVPLTFQEVTSQSQADIIIRYVDLNTFKKYSTESNVAVGFSPPPNMCAGNLLLNDDYHHFSLDPNEANSKDLVYTAIHEIGHILGLCHSNNSNTVMYYEWSPKRQLHEYDIKGIKEIYPSLTVKNSFEGGTIMVGIDQSAATVNSPSWKLLNESQTVNLEAVEQTSGQYSKVWYVSASSNRSSWRRKDKNDIISYPGYNKVYSFTSSSSDLNSEYAAGRKIFAA